MASSSNGNGNLMDEFEEAFQACLHALTKQESNTGITKEEIELEVQQTANKFIDVARQMEAFFLQKRFLISALKPETLLKDENLELKLEINRKDILINKHYARLEEWKSLLSDQQQQGYNKPLPAQSELRTVNIPGNPGGIPPNVGSQMGMGATGMSGAIQAQLQQQHLQAQQQQQQQMMQAQQMHQMQQMQVGAQQMYMQQGGPVGGRGAFNQGTNMLQGPLAYLEKTTSNIDLVGMGDGRR